MQKTEKGNVYELYPTSQAASAPPLPASGGGGTYGGMDVVDAKIAAAEARTDTKFAEMMGELRKIETATANIKTTVVATGIGAVALVVAIFAYGAQMFSTGLDADAIAQQAAQKVAVQTSGELSSLRGEIERTNKRIIEFLDSARPRVQPQLLGPDIPRSPEPPTSPSSPDLQLLPIPQAD